LEEICTATGATTTTACTMLLLLQLYYCLFQPFRFWCNCGSFRCSP